MKYINTDYGIIAVHENDLISNILEKTHIWEPYNIALINQYVKPGDVVLDIGANIGLFTIVLSDAVQSTGIVHSFEPVKMNYILLEENTNTLSNVIRYNTALGNVNGNITMNSEYGNAGNSYIINEVTGDIPIIRLDSLNLSPNFIKIDVQGFEYDVILGGLETIKKYRPIMIVELEDLNNSIPTSYKNSKTNVIKLLSDLNYSIYNIESEYPVDYLFLPN